MLKIYSKYLVDKGYEEDLEICGSLVKCDNVTMNSPTEEFLKYIQKFGLPICLRDKQSFPIRTYFSSIKEMASDPIKEGLILFNMVSCCLGIPLEIPLIQWIRIQRDETE